MLKFLSVFLLSGSIAFACLQEESTDALLIAEYVEEIMISIDKTVEGIIAIPSYQQTFENTIKPCIGLTEDVFHAFILLYTLRGEQTLQAIIDWELKKIHSFLRTEVFDNSKFQQSLLIYLANMLDQNGGLNAYRRCLSYLQFEDVTTNVY